MNIGNKAACGLLFFVVSFFLFPDLFSLPGDEGLVLWSRHFNLEQIATVIEKGGCPCVLARTRTHHHSAESSSGSTRHRRSSHVKRTTSSKESTDDFVASPSTAIGGSLVHGAAASGSSYPSVEIKGESGANEESAEDDSDVDDESDEDNYDYDEDDTDEQAVQHSNNPEGERTVRKGTLRRGEGADAMFQNASTESRRQFLSAARGVFASSFQPGHFFTVVSDGLGKVRRFEYEIDRTKRLVVEGEDKPVARLEKVQYATLLTGVLGIIREDLFQAVADVGETPQLAAMLSEVFGTEINFLKDIAPGDSFAAVVEKRYQNGSYYGYGRIVAASFTSQGRTIETFLFPDERGDQYYNANGENTHRAFLQAPLATTRITSKFSMSRKHPVLGYSRPHQGVDYAAPTGTPVKAVSDGVISRRGWAGEAGNQVVVNHSGGLESLYSHLSGFARGVGPGTRVTQGQVIGFVGMTGLATGPHLDFRLRQNGSFVNPAKMLNPRSAPVKVSDKQAFLRVMALEKGYLTGQRPLSEYKPEYLLK